MTYFLSCIFLPEIIAVCYRRKESNHNVVDFGLEHGAVARKAWPLRGSSCFVFD
ncbi:hypothetical protein OIU77_005813 [Salix suchowensis]|uniref:Uncharacterized protein n=2 Tax=Salix TaxID=40685 RepID=A0A9Q0UKW7_SALPP|nr:hypothetical protein OIU77_005813 [Salix suchowensis]KAJ6731707.1 hypothetical protein OIU79_002938 [Salix purpurea]